MDSASTQLGFYFLNFNTRGEGFAFAAKYFEKDKVDRTELYITKDRGKNWIKKYSFKERLNVMDLRFWNDSIITFVTSSGYLHTLIGNKEYSFNFLDDTLKAKLSENVYPLLDGKDFVHNVIKVDGKNEIITRLLQIKEDYYVKLAFSSKIWCVGGEDYTLVSKDRGSVWKYYCQNTSGSMYGIYGRYTIINEKFIFNGSVLYRLE